MYRYAALRDPEGAAVIQGVLGMPPKLFERNSGRAVLGKSATGACTRLGQRLAKHGFDPFVIDQSVTVEYKPGVSPRRAAAQRLRSELEALGGTSGFLREEDPDPVWREDRSADARVLSLYNVME